jgi:O-methyltransferase
VLTGVALELDRVADHGKKVAERFLREALLATAGRGGRELRNLTFDASCREGDMISGAKDVGKALLQRLGYEIRRVRSEELSDRDYVAARTVNEAEFYTKWSAPCPIFTPWTGHRSFQQLYDGIEPYTIVPPERCYVLASFAHYASNLPGNFAECGVYNGGTALLLARVLKQTVNKKLYLFDSFQGLPQVDPEREPWFSEGEFASESLEGVREVLSEFANIVDIRPGWIPQTFSGLEHVRFAFVHLDVDLYRSNRDCCNYFYPRLVPGGVLVFDEYGFAPARGEKEAVDEFFADKPENPIVLPTAQAVVIKVPDEKETLKNVQGFRSPQTLATPLPPRPSS